jgi:tetratricopeptide (TPR) repeat protein
VAVAVLGANQARAQTIRDRVRTDHGSESGNVTDMSPLEVTLDKGSSGTQKIPVNEINTIVFHGEPTVLSQARVNARNGGYATALEALERINLNEVDRDFIRQDIEFYKALCEGKLALGSGGQIAEAGRALNAFVRSYPQNFHYLEAAEVMGDLLMASDRYDSALKQYAELTKTPWPDYKMRAAVLVARTLQAQDKHAEAVAEFDKVLQLPDNGPEVQQQKLAATLGKAESLAAMGNVDEAVGMIEGVIQDADPEQKQLHARAYNALGNCYEQAGKTKDALLAYLHVDVLYNTVPEAHAEALSHLVPLWEAVGQGERSREARQTLQEQYTGSRWAQ